MALLIGDNFNYLGQKPNFERDSFDTLESMISYPETSIDDGHISYCKETKKHYIYNSSNESTNSGRWREFSVDGTYVIDYITGNTETITLELFNEILLAINDNRNIIIYIASKDDSAVNLFYTISCGVNQYGIFLIANNAVDNSVLYMIVDIRKNLTIKIIYTDVPLLSVFRVAIGLSSGLITLQEYDDLKRAVNNHFTIVILHGTMKEYQYCTTAEMESPSGNIYLQTVDANSSTRITVKPNLTYTIEESTSYESLPGEEGLVLTKTSDGAAWLNIPNTSGPIQDFNDAPEVVKNTLAAAMVGTTHIDNYTELEEAVGDTTITYLYNTTDSGGTGFGNLYITVGHYNDYILYTMFLPVAPVVYFANIFGYIRIDNAGNIERHDYTNLILATTDGISIDATSSALADGCSIILKTKGTGDQFLADNGLYKAIDTSSSSVILPFEKAPEVLQNFIRDGLSHPGKEYTIDYANDLFSALTSLDGTVYLDLNNDAGILYIYVLYTSEKCGVVLDAPIYSSYYHLRALIVTDTSGNLESWSIANALVAEENRIQLSCAANGVGSAISLDITGDGTKYLGDDGDYHEVKQVSSYGTTAERPSNVSIGFQYFDTDLNRPIWWNGTEWVGATDANIVKLTQAQYEELPTKDPDTIYFIKG